MQFAVILKVRPEATEAQQARLREAEIRAVWSLHTADTLRAVYFHDGPGALLILEAEDRAAAEQAAHALPMVSGSVADADVLELRPFTGYAALFASESAA